MVKYVTGTLAGGLVAYAWAMFAWAVLPFNMSHFSNIKDEEKVSAMISRSMPERGIYLLPGMPDTRDLDDKAAEKANLATMERRLQGPVGFFVVAPRGAKGFTTVLTTGLLIHLLGAFCMVYIVRRSTRLNAVQTGLYTAVIALTGGVLCQFPLWNWWEFPTGYIIGQMADLGIGWFLAGLAIARFT